MRTASYGMRRRKKAENNLTPSIEELRGRSIGIVPASERHPEVRYTKGISSQYSPFLSGRRVRPEA